MQHLLLPTKRIQLLTGTEGLLQGIERRLNCSIKLVDENRVEITGESYDEFNAKNVMTAYGRGFDITTAFMLLSEDYFFSSVNMKEMFKTKDQIRRVKARLIGRSGRTKEYIEEVSGTKISIYGNTISFIGTIEDIKVADSAINILLEGGTHKKAYRVMESVKKRMSEGRVYRPMS